MPEDDSRESIDFARGERGKFYRPDAKLSIPVHLDEQAHSAVVLDLDDRTSCHPEFSAVVDDSWPEIVKEVASVSGGDFLSQLECDSGYLKNNLARELRELGVNILLRRYSFVMGYHGCRIGDKASYSADGLRPSDPAALIGWARELFSGISGLDAALRDIGSQYVNHNRGKVGLLMSGVAERDKRHGYAQGSELICALANRLGPEAKRRFAKTGSPHLVQCKIPIEWLDSNTTFPVRHSYAHRLLAALVYGRMWPQNPPCKIDGGYLLTRGVPPAYLLRFIEMTDAVGDQLWIET